MLCLFLILVFLFLTVKTEDAHYKEKHLRAEEFNEENE